MHDKEIAKDLQKSFKDLPVGTLVQVTGWITEDSLWEKEQFGWRKLEIRSDSNL